MSRTFTDENLLTWEAFASAGDFGLAMHPKVVFNCLSDPLVHPRFVVRHGNEADAEGDVHQMSDDQLRALLRESRDLDERPTLEKHADQ
jgi:hypothetical protein